MQLGSVLREIQSIAINHDDDLIDRYNHRFTVIFLAFFILVIATKQYYGEPIVCWTPAHFSGAHNHYANTIWYIFTENKKIIPQNTSWFVIVLVSMF